MTTVSKNIDACVAEALASDFEGIYTKIDPKVGLHAIIALHSTKRGPAIGGCRHIPYPDMASAMRDAMALGKMMTYKAALSDLPHGGGKSVILRPPHVEDNAAYMRSFGEFVHQLNGRYITAVDSNTNSEDMAFIAQTTPHVLCTDAQGKHIAEGGNAAPSTALGVFRAMEAAIDYTWQKKKRSHLHVAIQGVGAVGYRLAKQLCEQGMKVTVSDTDPEKLKHCVDTLKVQSTSPEQILQTDCDILAPCALGHAINAHTVPTIRANIIVGAANNQLASEQVLQQLVERGICYIPDFLANAGGLIFASGLYHQQTKAVILEKINAIYDRVMHILERAAATKMTSLSVCHHMVQERLHS